MGQVVDTSTTDTVANLNNFSILLDKNKKSEQANTTKIISDNNESNKLTCLRILIENNIELNRKS